MKVATKANVRTANAAKDSLGKALEVAFRRCGDGLGSRWLGILGLGGLFAYFSDYFGAFENKGFFKLLPFPS